MMKGEVKQMEIAFEIVLRLVLAAVLGGFIGFEREHTNRPAGFRTHILVCIGSALVMITSEFAFAKYMGTADVDLTRLGAQVISGIGFLGAGTIIRDGFNVRGLTTAASLWAVACVGIAVGIGFYTGAIAATALVFITLMSLKKTEIFISKKSKNRTIVVEADDMPGQVGDISRLLEQFGIHIRNIKIYMGKDKNLIIKLAVKLPGKNVDLQAVSELASLAGVTKVYEE
jgi:putative Mg2+ transporter-C (MgtC) family protein